MKKALPIVVVVIVIAVVIVWFLRKGEEPVAEDAKVVVEKILEPRAPAPEPVEMEPLVFETVEVTEEIGAETAEEPEAEAPVETRTVPAARVSAEQVLVVVNGVPFTAAELMLPGQFKKDKPVVLPTETLEEVLERSVQRELILQEAEVQGVALSEQDMVQLEKMYEHLTSNPLDLGGGWTLGDLNVLGDDGDAAFHVRDKAARLLQNEFLKQAGEADTAEARLAFRERLRSGASVQMVDTAPPAAGEE